MAMSKIRRIVILGKTGTGKSSLTNTIFGEELFKIGHTANSETSKCRAKTKSVNGRNITLIDTPGLFDTHRPEEKLKPDLVRCITEFAPGPHAFLIVLKAERFTEQEQAVITKINQSFSEEVFKYATVLFTHGDQLPKGQTIEFLFRDNKHVSDLVKKCGGRCHVIDNKYWKNNLQDEYRSNQFQVKELLKTIEKMTEANKGSYYTNEMLQAVEAGKKQEEERIRQSPGNMSEEEIRETAKDKVSERLLISLAGITTGVLLGALFGLGLMGGEVVNVLKTFRYQHVLPTIAAGLAAAAVAAKGGIAGKAGIGVGIMLAAATVGGAMMGGFAGHDAAEEADTPCEAAKGAEKAVMDEVQSSFKARNNTAKYKSESKALLSPQSSDL